MLTSIIDAAAINIPNQFCLEIRSLKSMSPTSADTPTIATLFMVNTVELSKPSILSAFKRNYMEP